MNASAVESIVTLRLAALSAFASLVIAVAMGLFAFASDPALQAQVPLESWPLHAKAMHYIAPWLSVGSAVGGVLLFVDCLRIWPVPGWVFHYYTSREAKIGLSLWAAVCLWLTWSVPIDIAIAQIEAHAAAQALVSQ